MNDCLKCKVIDHRGHRVQGMWCVDCAIESLPQAQMALPEEFQGRPQDLTWTDWERLVSIHTCGIRN